jgi:cytochrome c-type biogenesis protein CcmH
MPSIPPELVPGLVPAPLRHVLALRRATVASSLRALRNAAIGALAAMLLVAPAAAKDAAPAVADPVLEARMQAIAIELRCLVCQNQTIADSNADLAVDLRNQVREMLKQGKSEREIIDYMTARYGDFVLYRPPVKTTTALLWFGPLALLVGGLVILVLVLRRRSRLAADAFEPDEPESIDRPVDAAGRVTDDGPATGTSSPASPAR